jgi:outer membrane immunogenic protein
MKRAITLSIGALALTATTLPTSAADLGAGPMVAQPLVNPPYSWTGLYIGANGGGKWGDFTGTERIAPTLNGVTAGGVLGFGSNNGSNTSFLAGGQIGFNWQVSQWVFGLEGDFDATSIRRSFIAPGTVLPPFLPGDTISLSNDWQASIRGRYGYAWDRFMVYVTGGVAFASIKANVNFPPAGGVPGLIATDTATGLGGTVGGGLEFGLWDNWSLGAEYRYTRYDHRNFIFAFGDLPIAPGTTSPLTATTDLTTHEVTARLNYRFGWGAPISARY